MLQFLEASKKNPPFLYSPEKLTCDRNTVLFFLCFLRRRSDSKGSSDDSCIFFQFFPHQLLRESRQFKFQIIIFDPTTRIAPTSQTTSVFQFPSSTALGVNVARALPPQLIRPWVVDVTVQQLIMHDVPAAKRSVGVARLCDVRWPQQLLAGDGSGRRLSPFRTSHSQSDPARSERRIRSCRLGISGRGGCVNFRLQLRKPEFPGYWQ